MTTFGLALDEAFEISFSLWWNYHNKTSSQGMDEQIQDEDWIGPMIKVHYELGSCVACGIDFAADGISWPATVKCVKDINESPPWRQWLKSKRSPRKWQSLAEGRSNGNKVHYCNITIERREILRFNFVIVHQQCLKWSSRIKRMLIVSSLGHKTRNDFCRVNI